MRTVPGKPGELTRGSRAVQAAYEVMHLLHLGSVSARYNLTVSDSCRFVWFRVAKVGTRTVMRHFRRAGVVMDAEHVGAVRYRPSLYRDHYKFAFVRNPWDRLVSCWESKVVRANLFGFSEQERKRMHDFEQFVGYVEGLNLERTDRHLRLQTSLVDLDNLDFIGRLESFDADFGVVLTRLGIAATQVHPKNVSRDRAPYASYYSDTLAERVEQLYGPDIRAFGYSFSG